MNRPHPTYSTNPRHTSAYRGRAEADVIEDYDGYQPDDDVYPHDEYPHDEYSDDVYSYVEPMDRRWIWVAGAAGAVLLVAVICTMVILGGGDSGSVTATVAPPAATTSAASAAPSPAPASPSPSVAIPSRSLPAETVTTVSPAPSAGTAPTAVPPPVLTTPTPRTVTYRVTGTRQLLDLVTVIYTDNRGALQTDVNVALPWTKQIVLDPGVELKSVTATSVTGQLNCSITDAVGTLLTAQNNNSLLTSCTQ